MLTNSPAQNSAAVAEQFRDIKPPFEIINPWIYVAWAAVLFCIAAAAVAFWLWSRKKRAQVQVIPPIPAHERARRKLEAALDLYDQPKPFCTLVSDAVRLYLEERFGLRAPERTTEEFLGELTRSNALTPTQKESVDEFLSACDLVKFARYEPGRPELEGLYNSALRLIEETEPQPQPAAPAGAIADSQSPIANPT